MSSPDSAELDPRAGERPAKDLGADVATEMQALFLVRLRTLLERRYKQGAKLSAGDLLMLDKAIYSTFCDCLQLGLSEQARALLRDVQES
jgi:hypothetical protein